MDLVLGTRLDGPVDPDERKDPAVVALDHGEVRDLDLEERRHRPVAAARIGRGNSRNASCR
jgi:hypothetical protein